MPAPVPWSQTASANLQPVKHYAGIIGTLCFIQLRQTFRCYRVLLISIRLELLLKVEEKCSGSQNENLMQVPAHSGGRHKRCSSSGTSKDSDIYCKTRKNRGPSDIICMTKMILGRV